MAKGAGVVNGDSGGDVLHWATTLCPDDLDWWRFTLREWNTTDNVRLAATISISALDAGGQKVPMKVCVYTADQVEIECSTTGPVTVTFDDRDGVSDTRQVFLSVSAVDPSAEQAYDLLIFGNE